MPFVIDEDAYARLGDYLIDVRNRLPDSEVSDVMEDIKSRIADIFTENIKTTSGIVTIELVHRMISIIGSPSTFGDMGNDPLFTPLPLPMPERDGYIAPEIGIFSQESAVVSRIISALMLWQYASSLSSWRSPPD